MISFGMAKRKQNGIIKGQCLFEYYTHMPCHHCVVNFRFALLCLFGLDLDLNLSMGMGWTWETEGGARWSFWIE